MNRIILLIGLVLMCGDIIAQVYTFEPLYKCETIQLESGGSTELYSIDSFKQGKFEIDLDKMKFTNPVTILSQPQIIDIKKITRLENNRIRIDLKKSNRFSPDLYYLQLDSLNKPLYLQQAEIIFTNYTSNPESLVLYSECTRNLVVSAPYQEGNPAPQDSLTKAMEKDKYADADNSFILENGYVIWTAGKGKSAVQHKIHIDNTYISTASDFYYIQISGKDDRGVSCSVAFCHSVTAYPARQYVLFERIEGGRWITMNCN